MALYRSSLPKQKRRPKPPLVRCDRYVASSHGDVRGLEPLGTLDHVELDLRAFLQGAEAVGVDGAEVHEDILTSAGRDEAETLRVVEPLDRTVATHSENLLILCSCCTRGDSEALPLQPTSHSLCNQQGSPLSHSIPIQRAPTPPAVRVREEAGPSLSAFGRGRWRRRCHLRLALRRGGKEDPLSRISPTTAALRPPRVALAALFRPRDLCLWG